MYKLSFLENWVSEHDLPKFRAKQLYQAINKNLISSWEQAIELPKDWKETLTKELPISNLKVDKKLEASNGDSIKLTFKTHDNLILESVLMRHKEDRNTVCVSTQIGCPMNCAFCATGKMGFTRNLTAEEIVDQVLEFARALKNRCPTSDNSLMSDICSREVLESARTLKPNRPAPSRTNEVTNVVFMGMGEPFLNYNNIMEAVRILNDNQGFNLGARHITISTSGFVPGILKFAEENIQVNLAISLHAPNNEIRNSIMPINRKYPLEQLLPAVSEYMEKTDRKVFFEYILLKNINDSKENIEDLIDLMLKYFKDQMQLVHINLIEFNEISPNPKGLKSPNNPKCPIFQSPSHKTTKDIFDYLHKNDILTTIRYRFGDDIGAACGQLAGK